MPKYKLVPGFPGYCVGDDGSVWSRLRNGRGYRKKFRKHSVRPLSNGYLQTLLCENGKKEYWLVHRLVLSVFIGPCPPGMETRHFPDRDKANNRLSNLSWASKKRNDRDKDIHGTRLRGSSHGRSRLTDEDVRAIRSSDESQNILAKRYGIAQTTVSAIRRRATWTHI